MRALWCGCAVRECMAHGARTAEAVTVNAANMSSTKRAAWSAGDADGRRARRLNPCFLYPKCLLHKYLVRTYEHYYINEVCYTRCFDFLKIAIACTTYSIYG